MARSKDLAADLGIDEGDVPTLLRQLGEQTPEMPDDLAERLRQMFDPHGERTAPAGLYWPSAADEPRRAYGTRRTGPDRVSGKRLNQLRRAERRPY
jgi:hypothetical protein